MKDAYTHDILDEIKKDLEKEALGLDTELYPPDQLDRFLDYESEWS